MFREIAFRHMGGVLVGKPDSDGQEILVATVNEEFMRLGYMMSQDLYAACMQVSDEELSTILQKTYPVLAHALGADVSYTPFYTGFPEQVMETDLLELQANACMHYWSQGDWKPDDEWVKATGIERTDWRILNLVRNEDFSDIIEAILVSPNTLSDFDKDAVKFLIAEDVPYSNLKIPLKETMAEVGAHALREGKPITPFVDTATDVLRVYTAMCDGDVSLSEPTKYKSLPRKQRKALAQALAIVGNEEDIRRHKGKWVKAGHSLHVGDFSDSAFALLKKARNNDTITTFNSKIEELLASGHGLDAAEALRQRPGDFTRRLDHLLRISPKQGMFILSAYAEVIDKVQARTLIQLWNHMLRRRDLSRRVSTSGGKFKFLDDVASIHPSHINALITLIKDTLRKRFSKEEPLNITIGDEMKNIAFPMGQEDSSLALNQLSRGSRIPFGDKHTLRLFTYWVGRDIDLSAVFYDERFKNQSQVSYTNIKDGNIVHSGDITEASNGAAEFIDVDIEYALKKGYRYMSASLYVYSGPTFAEHDTVYVGWMTREKPKSGEAFSPKTVEQKLDVVSETKSIIPVMFDLEERCVVWVDLPTSHAADRAINTESNAATTQDVVRHYMTAPFVTVSDILELHDGRSAEEAPVVAFGFGEDVEPNNLLEIMKFAA